MDESMFAVRDPIRLIPVLFLGLILVGTVVLSLPIATTDGSSAPLLTAFFTDGAKISDAT